MARIRSSPRNAPRHTGRQYQASRQYEFDEYEKLTFGPFERVRPTIRSQQEALSVLRSTSVELPVGLTNVLDGRVVPLSYPPLGYSHINGERGEVTDKVLGVATTVLKGVRYRIAFVEDNSTGKLDVHIYDESGAKTEVSSGYDSNGNLVQHVFWGGEVYFIQQGFDGLIAVDVAAGTLSLAQRVDPNIWFIFILDNNLCVVTQDSSNTPKIFWFADSDPTFATGAPPNLLTPGGVGSSGGGDYIVNTTFGEATGVALFGDTALINFQRGAITMRPTGTLPAFRFASNSYLKGTRALNATDSGSTAAAFISDDGYVYGWKGGDPKRVGTDPPRFNVLDGARIKFVDVLNGWLVWDGPSSKVWFLSASLEEFTAFQELPDSLADLSVVGEWFYGESSTGAGDDFSAVYFYSETDGVRTQELSIPVIKPYESLGSGGAVEVSLKSHEVSLGGPFRFLYADVTLWGVYDGQIDGGGLTLSVVTKAMTQMDEPLYVTPTIVNVHDEVSTFRFPLNVIGDTFYFILNVSADVGHDYPQPATVDFTVSYLDHVNPGFRNV